MHSYDIILSVGSQNCFWNVYGPAYSLSNAVGMDEGLVEGRMDEGLVKDRNGRGLFEGRNGRGAD